MRVLLCKGQLLGPISGADETLVTYATQLMAAGHSISVLLMFPYAPDNRYYLRLRQAGVPVSTIASNHSGTSLNAGRRLAASVLQALPSSRNLLRRNAQKITTRLAARHYVRCREYLKQHRADLIHVITPDPSAMVMIQAAHAEGVPIMYQELGTPYHPLEFEAYYKQFTSVLPLCSEITALSPSLARQCYEQLPYSNAISVLPIMVDGPRTEPVRCHWPEREVSFGFAARIEPLKGPMLLIEAFARLYGENENVSLKIAGAGSQSQQAAARAAQLGVAHRCHFPGVYSQPEQRSDFMHGLDVFVLPSHTEGTPNSIIEAMAHGLPVIASAVGGITDMITAETGIIVPRGDIAALAGAMSRLAADHELRRRMGAAAKDMYEKLFSPKAVLPIIQDTYRRIVAGGAAGTAPTPARGGSIHPWA